jgi:hypothetical protein
LTKAKSCDIIKVQKRKGNKKMITITRYYVYNKYGKNMAAVDTEVEAQAIVKKNEKRGWTYEAHSWKQENQVPVWALAGCNTDPSKTVYNTCDF